VCLYVYTALPHEQLPHHGRAQPSPPCLTPCPPCVRTCTCVAAMQAVVRAAVVRDHGRRAVRGPGLALQQAAGAASQEALHLTYPSQRCARAVACARMGVWLASVSVSAGPLLFLPHACEA
jgi:hypothetical protein